MGDGFTVIQRLKQIPAMAEIPIIAYSGMDTETHHRKALEAGADIFLSKPVRNDVLLWEIEKLLATRLGAAGQGKKKIMVVEHDPNFRQMLDAYLRRAGYDIAIAVDSVTVLSAVLREKPDIILLDLELSHGSGMSVLQKIKMNPATAHIPVIAVSETDRGAHQDRSTLASAIAYFQKPIKNEALLDAIRKSLNQA
jgi:DNA-binding response OmpR family regulator